MLPMSIDVVQNRRSMMPEQAQQKGKHTAMSSCAQLLHQEPNRANTAALFSTLATPSW
jgi:hypothetical protein